MSASTIRNRIAKVRADAQGSAHCAEGCRGKPDCTLYCYWGATKSGRDAEKHATYSIVPESYTVNTGDRMRDVKEGGSRKARAV